MKKTYFLFLNILLVAFSACSSKDEFELPDGANFSTERQYYLKVSTDTVKFEATPSSSYYSRSKSVNVASDTTYTVSTSDSWLTATTGTYGITVTVADNSSVHARYGSVTVSLVNGQRSAVIPVKQEGATPTVSLSSTSVVLGGGKGAETTVTVRVNGEREVGWSSNTFFDVRMPDDTTLVVRATADNDADDSREGVITVTSKGENGETSRTIRVTQARRASYDTSKNILTLNVTGTPVTYKMILVTAGTFTMGKDISGGTDVENAHKVTLTQDYYIGETEVTNEIWNHVMGTSLPDANKAFGQASWTGIVNQFLPALNKMTGLSFRLPSEAEWEYAARGATNFDFLEYRYSGSNYINVVGWIATNSGDSIHEVKKKAANWLKLYDMSGNVWEWCYDARSEYSAEDQTDPIGGPESEVYRILRGGSYKLSEEYARVTTRYSFPMSMSDDGFGFRFVISASAIPTTR